ncbi:phosphoribosylformylglycinamidine synthase [Dyadobacter luteus]|uniref:Phosphoribosylformylglycinamidine synthase n=1 Tax=Dyadobacter luteus TaxID=2259619 RepID=A0A3D8YF49_9BACT|nr:HAEPLYID family protein [Dyadobacter luteus]REA62835.1 phosphoribosylformylglycinamidine synthase [Dyadobacter luteus]
MKFHIIMLLTLIGSTIRYQQSYAQKNEEDSLYIREVEEHQYPAKVLHAEPLYIDLIRDLGARKGEKEWNVGLGLNDRYSRDEYIALVEYEWAPINRLGLEVELPFTIYPSTPRLEGSRGSRLNGLKVAGQYSFLVSEKWKTTMAIGYLHELELPVFADYGKGKFLKGNIYNPFFIAAKRWGGNFHSLLYTGPVIHHDFASGSVHTVYQANTSFHYMIPKTKNFIGIEFNKEFNQTEFNMTIRPQMRVSVADNLIVGIVTGIPVDRTDERLSTFLRLIYEPGHRIRH